jgi:hypothetical protein
MEQKIDEILRMDPTLIDARLRTMLYKIPEERALHILTDFQKALITNRDGIRNPVAYLMGMAQRVLSAKELPESSRVKRELDRLFREGRIAQHDIDERCRDMLKHLPEEKAIEALHELDSTDVSTLHNIAAFFMGIMKKHTKVTKVIPNDPFRLGGSESMSHSNGSNGGGMMTRASFSVHDLPPAPKIMPADLSYNYGEQEYIPEMPKVCLSLTLSPYLFTSLSVSLSLSLYLSHSLPLAHCLSLSFSDHGLNGLPPSQCPSSAPNPLGSRYSHS